MSATDTTVHTPDSYRLPTTGPWANAWKIALGIGVLGVALAALGWSMDSRRFAFSWLFAFMGVLTVGLGGIFFVFIQHLTASGWSVSVRRLGEFMLTGLPIMAILFLPVVPYTAELFEWDAHASHGDASHGDDNHGDGSHGDSGHGEGSAEAVNHGATHAVDKGVEQDHHTDASAPFHELHEELLAHKKPYLNKPFFLGRAAFYFLSWIALTLFFFVFSTRQDYSRDKSITALFQKASPAAAALFGITLTFAAFDWMMSMEPTWYSTIYGVYVFAGGAITSHAVVTLLALGLKKQGALGNVVHTEHFHDLGKMTFAFVVFWAYIAFSQLMLQWYASIPEEVAYYHQRWNVPGWKHVSLFLVLGHFLIPFLFMMSRNIKRRLSLLGVGSAWMLIMHMVDIYWFIMPNYDRSRFSPHWMDVACLLAVGGLYMTVVFAVMRRHSLVAVGDPRLSRAIHHVSG